MNITNRRVLILSDCLPSLDSTAGTVINSLIAQLPYDWDVKVFSIRNPYLPSEFIGHMPGVSITEFSEPQSDWSGVFLPFVRYFGEKLAYAECMKISKKIQQAVNDFEPDFFLTLPQTHAVARVAAGLVFNKKELVKIAMMTDHYSWWARERALSESTASIFAADWWSTYEDSNVRLLPSERASELFQSKAPRNVVLYPASQSISNTRTGPILRNHETIKVAFAGQDYAKAEILRFLVELGERNWTLYGRKVEFHHFGTTTIKKHHQNHTLHGKVLPEVLVKKLSDFDFALLPYPSGDEMSIISRTSFPSKFSSYLAAGLPVLYSGPSNSAVWELIKDSKSGAKVREFLEEDLKILAMDWAIPIQELHKRLFSEEAFDRSIVSIFGFHPSERRKGGAKLVSRPESHSVASNEARNWRFPAMRRAEHTTNSSLSPSRALRFLASPVWLVSKVLGSMRLVLAVGSMSAAKRLVRKIGRLRSKGVDHNVRA
jgi:hypothetical protein